jgi:class 3 adenylate cyclase/putative methionine-R-sulfoxide reductase with GAF domain
MTELETTGSKELIRENESLREQRQAVYDVLRQVARSEGLQPVLNEIAEAAMRLCRGDHVQLYMIQGDLLHVMADSELGRAAWEYAKDHPHARDRTTVVGRAALTGETVQIPDVLDDPEYSYGGQEIVGFRALLGVPILLEGELIGAIAVGRNTPGRYTDDEVELVNAFADQAAIAIANTRLIEAVERQRTELARFLSPQVADLISSEQGEQLLAGHRAYITCVFCDLRGFTSFAETAAPEDLFEVLREYHGALGQLIPEYGGTLEHFAGDGVMVFFNDPVPVAEHELQAARFALAAQERLEELGKTWRKRGVTLELGVGIEAGYATLGRIGFEGRYDYGVLGPVTPLAFRLSSAAVGGQILVGQRAFGAIEDAVDAESVGELELKGFGRPISAYEIRGLRN